MSLSLKQSITNNASDLSVLQSSFDVLKNYQKNYRNKKIDNKVLEVYDNNEMN
jgi:hypothetical protein